MTLLQRCCGSQINVSKMWDRQTHGRTDGHPSPDLTDMDAVSVIMPSQIFTNRLLVVWAEQSLLCVCLYVYKKFLELVLSREMAVSLTYLKSPVT